MSGVPTKQVPKVIRLCASTFGVDSGVMPDPWSVGRFILEGGVAAKIQAGNVLLEAQGMHT
jgi:hypothetical protein